MCDGYVYMQKLKVCVHRHKYKTIAKMWGSIQIKIILAVNRHSRPPGREWQSQERLVACRTPRTEQVSSSQ